RRRRLRPRTFASAEGRWPGGPQRPALDRAASEDTGLSPPPCRRRPAGARRSPSARRLRAFRLHSGSGSGCDRATRSGRSGNARCPRPGTRAGAVQLTERDVVAAVRRLENAGIDYWIEGGWGVDALLSEQTRPHDDLDLGVRMEDIDRICPTFAEFACDDAE